jgi:hypothetical protein
MEEKSKTLVIGAIALFGAQSAAAQDASWGVLSEELGLPPDRPLR